jgi:hypothetical protein
VELRKTTLPRKDGLIKFEEYICPKGHVFERTVGRWRSTISGLKRRRGK